MTPTLYLGFCAIGGILAGYFSARLAPWWVFAGLMFACAALAIALLFWVRTLDADNALWGEVFLMMTLAPFALCALLAGGLGLIVRRVTSQKEMAP